MIQKTWAAAALILALGVLSIGCQSGGIGDPCIPEDEYQQYFSGYAVSEVNIESRSFQCETRLCLVNHFQGRVTCPYGQTADDANATNDNENFCHIPGYTGNGSRIKVAVNRQLQGRPATDSVYCSCRCGGPDKDARYCKCPTGFQCVELLNKIQQLGSPELAGSYCVKDGTAYDKNKSSYGIPCPDPQPGADPPCGSRTGQ
ncbi:MAG TPA: hypothetical protein VJT73_19585 [Polyangiaceae bacterium]|nr:hypothetical protein [Polyangiaceae bacterium]